MFIIVQGLLSDDYVTQGYGVAVVPPTPPLPVQPSYTFFGGGAANVLLAGVVRDRAESRLHRELEEPKPVLVAERDKDIALTAALDLFNEEW